MVFFQFAITVLMISSFSSLYIAGIRMKLSKELKICIESTTRIQRQHRRVSKSLLALNPYASSLRIKRKSAEIAYRTAPPPAKPPALAHLQRVKMQQRIFRYKQNKILKLAQAQSKAFSQNLKIQGFQTRPKTPKLELYKYPVISDSPSYKLKVGYSKLKKVIAFKKLKTHLFIPNTILKVLKPKSVGFTVKCGATMLKKRGLPSDIKLIEDK